MLLGNKELSLISQENKDGGFLLSRPLDQLLDININGYKARGLHYPSQ